MKSTTVTDRRYHFPRIEALLNKGHIIDIRKRGKVIARLHPVRSKAADYPELAAKAQRN